MKYNCWALCLHAHVCSTKNRAKGPTKCENRDPGWAASKTFTRSLLAVSQEAPPGTQWRHSQFKVVDPHYTWYSPWAYIVKRLWFHATTAITVQLWETFFTLLELISVPSSLDKTLYSRFWSDIHHYCFRSLEERCQTQPFPHCLQKEEIIFRRRRNPRGPSLPSSRHNAVNSLPSKLLGH